MMELRSENLVCALFVVVLHAEAEAQEGRAHGPIIGCHQPEVQG